MPRKQSLELNFDGLTDSVTNLVGALILLVVLLIGITQHAVYTPPPASVVANNAGGDADHPVEDLEALLRDLDGLSSETARIRNGVNEIEKAIPAWRTSVDDGATPTASN